MLSCHPHIRRSVKLVGDCCKRRPYTHLRLLSRGHGSVGTDHSFWPFEHLVSLRKREAERSLLVEVAGVSSCPNLLSLCTQYGKVHKMFHYTVRCDKSNKEMILVEFEDCSALEQVFQAASHSTTDTLPAHSPMVWFSATGKNSPSPNRSTHASTNIADVVVPSITVDVEELKEQIWQCSDISEQIQVLYNSQKLTELGWRLRFFSCRQIEVALSGLFPKATVLPFGSSVNSFGNVHCDLDMILLLSGLGPPKEMGRLMYQGKTVSGSNSRRQLQRNMEVVADMMDRFMPGCVQVQKILNARVPIIRYRQDLTDLECDLSMCNRSGFYMSQILYMYGSLDERVRPLVFAVRHWARDQHITSTFAGGWVTNFSLTLMVLFYLMNTSPRLVLSLNDLSVTKGFDDEGNRKFNFPENLTHKSTSENHSSLEMLLRGFFEFYDNFNFRERGLSIVTGNSFVKPEHNALYIQNPLEPELNVSRNVTVGELDRMRREVSAARYLLEGSLEMPEAENSEPWGAMCLWTGINFGSGKTNSSRAGKHYAINWKDVFHSEDRKSSRPPVQTNSTSWREVFKSDSKRSSIVNSIVSAKDSNHSRLRYVSNNTKLKSTSGKSKKNKR